MNQFSRSIALWLVLGLMFLLLFNIFSRQQPKEPEIVFSDFLNQVEKGQVAQATIQGDVIKGETPSGDHFKVNAPAYPDLVKTLREKGVKIAAKPAEGDPWWMVALVQWFPVIVLAALWIFFMRQMQIGGGKAMSFGKSRAKLLTENTHKVTFGDVAGRYQAKNDMEEIIQFLRAPKRFTRLGGRIPKGVLLVGAPGTGKPLLARAIAGEAGVPFFSISGSDFVEMFVGVGASRVRDLFVQGKKHAPCIIFIDEIDAVGRQRGAGLGGGHDEREQTLNQLLVEMDGFDQNTGVILIAATNRPDVLDPALLRPGRFDRQIVVDRADVRGRQAILGVHSKNKPLSKEVSLETLARRTPGFSGADLENLLNEAALLAARRNKSVIEMTDCDEAIDRVLVGPERKSIVMSQREKENPAFHESGHAIVGGLTPNSDPVHKVTIIPRGMALGLTWSLPDDDRHSQTKNEILATIKRALAGRIAEEIKFGDVTTGASNDFEQATALARRMVTQYGMSDILGPIQYGRGNHQVFLGRDFGEDRNYSEEIAGKIDAEVRKIIDNCYNDARKILEVNWDKVERMANSLLEHETVEAPEVMAILGDKPWRPSTPIADKPVEESQAAPAPPELRPERPKRLPPTI